jgi:soluble lytic murein transglycosylase-like protein
MKRKIKIGIMAVIFAMSVFCMNANAQEDCKVPDDVIAISQELGERYNICPELIQAICYRESRFVKDAVNGDCIGIMQVSAKWHQERMEKLKATDLTDIRQNMNVAVDYLAELIKDGEDMEEALMRYHGERGINQRLKNGEMSSYVESILILSEQLEREHGK